MLLERAGRIHDQIALLPEHLGIEHLLGVSIMRPTPISSRCQEASWRNGLPSTAGPPRALYGNQYFSRGSLVPKVVISPGLSIFWRQKGQRRRRAVTTTRRPCLRRDRQRRCGSKYEQGSIQILRQCNRK